MLASEASDQARPGWGAFCILIGLLPIATALRLLPVQPGALHAPRWVLFLCGFAFVNAGAVLLAGPRPRLRSLFAMLLMTAMGATSGWIALFGDPGSFSGGVPLISPRRNVLVARWLFGFGAVLLLAMAASAARQTLRPVTGRRSEDGPATR